MQVLIEARPGAGKTTALRRVAGLLAARGVSCAGILTDEIREGGRRVGFAVAGLSGGAGATLAHVALPGPPRVGRYGVDLGALERIALPELRRRDADVVLVDELGKMELASPAFREAVLELFESRRMVLATVHVFRHPFSDALKARSGVEVVRLTRAVRDGLPALLVERLVTNLAG
jgi:nucleoside-triphosphatase